MMLKHALRGYLYPDSGLVDSMAISLHFAKETLSLELLINT